MFYTYSSIIRRKYTCYIDTDTPEHEKKMKYGIKTQGRPLAFRVEIFSQACCIDVLMPFAVLIM
jgi:hypothetical protein